MKVVTVTERTYYGGIWKSDPETETVAEMKKEEVMEFLAFLKACGRRVFEDDRKYWTVFQKAYDEIIVSTYWKEN